MKERPILFSAPMVRAILDGSKTQTRRVAKGTALVWLTDAGLGFTPEFVAHPENGLCPYGQPGDRLWVRESLKFVAVGDNPHEHAVYAADGVRVHRCPDLADWACDGLAFNCARSVPSIHMPRWASRILLEVTGVRVERLQDISDSDAVAEGTHCYVCGGRMDGKSEDDCHCFHRKATASDYRNLWESINGAGSWEVNPWVWVVEFKRITACAA